MLVYNFLWLAPCARKRMNYVCDKQAFLGPKHSKPIHQIRQCRETGVEEMCFPHIWPLVQRKGIPMIVHENNGSIHETEISIRCSAGEFCNWKPL